MSDNHLDSYEEYYDKEGRVKYRKRKKLASGMTAEFGFSCYTEKGWGLSVYPSLTIYQKRKSKWPTDKRTTTGRDGLEPAMWALECLRELETVEESMDFVRIVVGWHDDRRRDIYTRVLGKRGYQRTVINGEEVLTKLFKADNVEA